MVTCKICHFIFSDLTHSLAEPVVTELMATELVVAEFVAAVFLVAELVAVELVVAELSLWLLSLSKQRSGKTAVLYGTVLYS